MKPLGAELRPYIIVGVIAYWVFFYIICVPNPSKQFYFPMAIMAVVAFFLPLGLSLYKLSSWIGRIFTIFLIYIFGQVSWELTTLRPAIPELYLVILIFGPPYLLLLLIVSIQFFKKYQ